jgi:hypothetical protein
VDERQPVHRAIGIDLGHRQNAVIENVLARVEVCRIEFGVRDEAVHVFKVVVIAHIDHHPAILVQNDSGRLVRHAAKGRALCGR